MNKGRVLCMGAAGGGEGGGGGDRGGFIFLSANRRAQGALLLFLSNYRGTGKNFFFNFPCFLMCSHDVPFKFLMGSHNVPEVHNVFPNMFSI
jgi:hypothetical protein